MRLWSIHPKYLDKQGLLGVWCEALLTQAVLLDRTKGYRNHPQLVRWRACDNPVQSLGVYLNLICQEGIGRGFKMNPDKIEIKPIVDVGHNDSTPLLQVTKGQVEYEIKRLCEKLNKRDPDRAATFSALSLEDVALHPCFSMIEGPIESWEKIVEPGQEKVKKERKARAKVQPGIKTVGEERRGNGRRIGQPDGDSEVTDKEMVKQAKSHTKRKRHVKKSGKVHQEVTVEATDVKVEQQDELLGQQEHIVQSKLTSESSQVSVATPVNDAVIAGNQVGGSTQEVLGPKPEDVSTPPKIMKARGRRKQGEGVIKSGVPPVTKRRSATSTQAN